MAFPTVVQLMWIPFVIVALNSSCSLGSVAVDAVVVKRKSFNVHDFGAKGDGKTDDSQAFLKAWNKSCSSSSRALIIVPSNKNYLLKPITFSGPCRSSITIQIRGRTLAWKEGRAYKKGRHWLLFKEVQNLVIEGGGTIDGNGYVWWQNSCKINNNLPCKNAPTALTFYDCKGLRVGNLKIKNSQQIHISFEKCVNVLATQLKITAPNNSPNTDGIHIANTQNIVLQNVVIQTGDDCISIATGTKQVRLFNIFCGPGHGISIGSLGEDNSKAYVSDVIVNGAILVGTTNGVRIKTWQGGSGVAKEIKFENIKLHNVQNPIIIDQNYCDRHTPCKQQNSAVQVENVLYKNISGTSSSKTALTFDCSKKYPCTGIVIQNVNIQSIADEGSTKATCKNVHLSIKGKVHPQC